MTGFKLSWKIENQHPPMEMSTQEMVTSLKFGKGLSKDFAKFDQNFNVSFLLPESLPDQIGNGSLVVKIQIERGKNWKQEFFYTEPAYVFPDRMKYWRHAETICKSLGGHLASIESFPDFLNVKNVAVDETFGWVGMNLRATGSGQMERK